MKIRLKSIVTQYYGDHHQANQEFAKKIGMAYPTVMNWLNGLHEPSKTTIERICKTFNVNEHWLLTGQGKMLNEMAGLATLSKVVLKDAAMVNKELPDIWHIRYIELDKRYTQLLERLDRALGDVRNGYRDRHPAPQ